MVIPSSNHHFFQADNQKAVLFTLFSLLELFSAAKLLFRWRKKTYLELRPLFRLQIFSVFKCCDIQGSRLIGYLRVSLIIDQLECPGFYFFLRWINPLLLHWKGNDHSERSWNQGNDPPPEKLWIGGQILHIYHCKCVEISIENMHTHPMM